MIDSFALALTHGLIFLAAWRLLSRPDLDEDAATVRRKWRARASPQDKADRPGA